MPSRLGLRELVARSKPDECPFCGDPRKPQVTKPSLTCGDSICRAAYIRLYYVDKRPASAFRKVVGRKFRPAKRGSTQVVFAEKLECGHYRRRGERERLLDVRLCRECLTLRSRTL